MFSVLLALAGASVAEQMAPARQGMLQCQMPDVLFRTCLSLTKVNPAGPGTYRFETALLLDSNGPVVVTMRSTVTAEGSRICNRINAEELADATYSVAGKEAAPARRAALVARVRRLYAPWNGKLICTELIPNDGEMVKVIGWMDGKRLNAGDYPMKWVDLRDGWIVAP